MPVYEYKCSSCGHIEGHRMKISESDIREIECEECGCLSVKIPSIGSFELTGGGWFAGGYSKGD